MRQRWRRLVSRGEARAQDSSSTSGDTISMVTSALLLCASTVLD
jgi:hypothetical protein